MKFLPHVASRAFHKPLLIEPRHGLAFLTTLAGLVASAGDRPKPLVFDDEAFGEPPLRTSSLPFGIESWSRDKNFPMVKNVALVEVDGTLVNKNGTVGAYCGLTGYDGIRTQIASALADPDVEGIALYVESPGGEVAGCFDLADYIFEARGTKPIVAIVDSLACSAAYALAAACDRITASSVGLLGSIGVIVAHMSIEKALEKTGVDVTLIYAGSHKADGNPYKALPEAVRAGFQAEIDEIWDQFAARVARGRGITAASVKKMQAQTFLAGEALDLKLCDAVVSPATALESFIHQLS